MKRKTLVVRRRRRGRRSGPSGKMKGTLANHSQVQLGSVLPLQFRHQSSSSTSASSSSRFQKLPDTSGMADPRPPHSEHDDDDRNGDADVEDKDFILSQDFFCTPDYITPDNQNLANAFDCNGVNAEENVLCPKSPEKIKTIKTKKRRQDDSFVDPLSPTFSDQLQITELGRDAFRTEDEVKNEKPMETGTRRVQNYVSQSAVALRCRVMPPPCIRNPYLGDASEVDVDPFGNQRSKCAGFFPSIVGGDGLSRYHTDFHEIQQIGAGNFSRVFKVLKRIDGCLYAVKQSTRQLHQNSERRKALMEVQALAALGCHENIVGYYSSWFENEQLSIQMELCDGSLSTDGAVKLFTEGEVLQVLHQISKALQFIHERGIAHLDVKPNNIYVKNGVYKLGDFGCATLLDQSLPVEEGDAHYMPQEILNENYNHLEKVDIFSLGAAIYELIRGSPLPGSRSQVLNIREGKVPLLPGHSLQFQSLLKVMVDPDPLRRPSAKELVENPIFDKVQRNLKTFTKF